MRNKGKISICFTIKLNTYVGYSYLTIYTQEKENSTQAIFIYVYIYASDIPENGTMSFYFRAT